MSNEGARVKWPAGFCVILSIVLTIMCTLGATRTWAAPFDPTGHDWEGYADLIRLMRDELGGRRVVVTNQLEWRALTPEDALVLVYPEQSADTASSGAFVRAGGRLALFDDFGAGDELLTSFDIRRVRLPAHPALALRDNPDLAVATPGEVTSPLTENVQQVVTNHASGLSQPTLLTVLRVRSAGGPDVALALAASSGGGKLVAIGDPSIAMNAMLKYPGNHTFAKNLTRYLVDGHPNGTVYVVVRKFFETGTFAGAGQTPHDFGAALRRMAATLGPEGFPVWILYWLSFVVAVFVVVWLYPRTTRLYRSAPARFTRPTRIEMQGGTAGHAAMLGGRHAYRGHAMLEWRRAFLEDLTAHFGLPMGTSSGEVVRRVAAMGVVDADAIRRVERVLLRMAEIDTMIAAKQTHALEPIRDEEVVGTGELMTRVIDAVHGQRGPAA